MRWNRALALVMLVAGCESTPETTDFGDLSATASDSSVIEKADLAESDLAHALASPGQATKSDGVTAANYSCNHHFVDPASGATTQLVHAVYYDGAGLHPNPDGELSLVDPTTGAMASAITKADSNGDLTITLPGKPRASWRTEPFCGDGCIATYDFNRAVPVGGGPVDAYAFEVDHYEGLGSHVGVVPQGTLAFVIATVTDCDGDVVMNATASLSVPACNSGSGGPCFAYFEGLALSTTATATDATGRFAIINAAPGTFTVSASAIVSASSSSEPIGTYTIPTFADTMSMVTLTPLPN